MVSSELRRVGEPVERIRAMSQYVATLVSEWRLDHWMSEQGGLVSQDRDKEVLVGSSPP